MNGKQCTIEHDPYLHEWVSVSPCLKYKHQWVKTIIITVLSLTEHTHFILPSLTAGCLKCKQHGHGEVSCERDASMIKWHSRASCFCTNLKWLIQPRCKWLQSVWRHRIMWLIWCEIKQVLRWFSTVCFFIINLVYSTCVSTAEWSRTWSRRWRRLWGVEMSRACVQRGARLSQWGDAATVCTAR